MIAIYTDLMYGFNDKIEEIISLDELTNKIEVLVIDYDLLTELNLEYYKHRMKIVVISDTYHHEDAISVYEQDIEHYIVVKSGADIDLVYEMLKRTSNRLSEVDINKEAKIVTINGTEIKLRSKEIAIYAYLRENRSKVCSRQSILVDVLKYHADTDSRLIDVYIKHLRAKLGIEGEKIKTIRGIGYKYE